MKRGWQAHFNIGRAEGGAPSSSHARKAYVRDLIHGLCIAVCDLVGVVLLVEQDEANGSSLIRFCGKVASSCCQVGLAAQQWSCACRVTEKNLLQVSTTSCALQAAEAKLVDENYAVPIMSSSGCAGSCMKALNVLNVIPTGSLEEALATVTANALVMHVPVLLSPRAADNI